MPVISSGLSFWINYLSKFRKFLAVRATVLCVFYSIGSFMQQIVPIEKQDGLIIGTSFLLAFAVINMLMKIYIYSYLNNYNKVYKLGCEIGEINYEVYQEFTSLQALHNYYMPYPEQSRQLDIGIKLQQKLLNRFDFSFPFILIYVFLCGLFICEIYQLLVYWNQDFSFFIAIWHVVAVMFYILITLSDIQIVTKGLQIQHKGKQRIHEQLNEPQILLGQTCGICLNINADIMLQCQGLHYFHINCLNIATEGRRECPSCKQASQLGVIV